MFCEGLFDGLGYAVFEVGGGDGPVAGGGDLLEVGGAIAHENGVSGDGEHGEIVPVVADGHEAGGVEAAGGAEAEEGGAFGAAGGEDVDDGEVAVGIFGAVEGDAGFGAGFADGGDPGILEQAGLGAAHALDGAGEHHLDGFFAVGEAALDGVFDFDKGGVDGDQRPMVCSTAA